MDDTWFDSFCGSPIWDDNVTWYTETPDFTPCLQKTVLVWLPCAFLWALSPLEICYIFHSKNENIPWNWRNISKLALTCFAIALSIIDYGYAISAYSQGTVVHGVNFYTPLIKAITIGVSAAFLIYNKKKGLRASGLLFFFWFLVVLFGIPQFRYEIQNSNTDDGVSFLSVTYILFYISALSVFVLNFFVDLPPSESKYELVENLCPQYNSAFQSRLFFSWFDSLVWKGFRNPLEVNKLWNLNREDLSKEVVPIFDHYWNKALNKNSVHPGLEATFKRNSASLTFTHGEKKVISVLPTLYRAFGPTFLFGTGLRLLGDILTFVTPEILKRLIAFVNSNEPMWKGYMYAVLLFVMVVILALINSHYNYRMLLVGLHVRTSLISAVYRKALRMSNNARKESTVGEIVNLMSVDCQRLLEATPQINMLWSAPFQIILALIFLWQNVGIAILPGIVVMIILIPVNSMLANKSKRLLSHQMKSKDIRIKLMNEILNGIKVLKMYAWEPSFEKEIHKIRNKEIKVLKQDAYVNGATSFIWTSAPILIGILMFATYILMDENNVLDAEKAFVSLALINIMRMPLAFLPIIVAAIIQAKVSLKRINKFLSTEELDPDNVEHSEYEKYPVLVEKGNFSWDSSDEGPLLRNINMKVQKGSLVAVVGTVGSGKSSLISALLGEMDKLNGRVNMKGSLAYVAQQAWIQNATLRDNITFGKSLDNSLYYRVVEACALKADFDMLPGGDFTEIGEKGINLSGGQKQRVSLARAVYRLTDIYLLDDPLSAVDSHVGKHIFEKVIGPTGLLKNKTRILVTHGITYLPNVDMIIVMKDGEITEQGTYKELLQRKGAFAEFLEEHLQEIIANDETSETDFEELKQQLENTLGVEEFQRTLHRAISRVSERSESGSIAGGRSRTESINRRLSIISNKSGGSLRNLRSSSMQKLNASNRNLSGSNKYLNGSVRRPSTSSKHKSTEKLDKKDVIEKNKLIQAEKAEVGSVKWDVYKAYIKAIGVFFAVNTLLWILIAQAFQLSSNMWLSVWSDNLLGEFNETVNATVTSPQEMYLVVYSLLGMFQVIATVLGTLAISIGAINGAAKLHSILLANVLRLPQSMFDTTPTGRILTRFSSDVNVLDVVFPSIIRFGIFSFFRMIAVLLPIIYATPIFMVAILPIAIIYYILQKIYIATSRQLKRLESIARAPIYSHYGESITGASTIRAYNMQQSFIKQSEDKVDINQKCFFPSIIAGSWLSIRLEVMGGFIVFFASLFAVLSRNTLNPGLVGLSITYALQIINMLNLLVRMSTEVETNIVAIERVKEYSEIKQEAAWNNPNYSTPKDWPDEGRVEFKNYQVRYREGLDLVLKGINFSTNSGEKIGIVGRTGAGKSSLTLALFRIIEAAGGSIVIDNVDISRLGLHDLRSRLTIIPQDPVLFSGTLRMNLDPFMTHSDEELWKALQHAHLKSFVESLAAGLNHQISEGGENLSVGQRQLVCLARALLRKTKLLILDEATAAVDLETDDLIQETIRREFSDCTILTIAHRLNTILDSDRVIVLDKGQVIEFDKPETLLKNKSSVFHSMAKDAGLV